MYTSGSELENRGPVQVLGNMDVTDVVAKNEVAIASPEVEFEPPPVPLTVKEDTFALAMIECGGNIRQAYIQAFGPNASLPVARGRELLLKPQVLRRIQELTGAIKEATFISIGGHLHELAEIRDLAKFQGQLKVALQAEQARGEVAGLYTTPEKNRNGATNIQINFVSAHDNSI